MTHLDCFWESLNSNINHPCLRKWKQHGLFTALSNGSLTKQCPSDWLSLCLDVSVFNNYSIYYEKYDNNNMTTTSTSYTSITYVGQHSPAPSLPTPKKCPKGSWVVGWRLCFMAALLATNVIIMSRVTHARFTQIEPNKNSDRSGQKKAFCQMFEKKPCLLSLILQRLWGIFLARKITQECRFASLFWTNKSIFNLSVFNIL